MLSTISKLSCRLLCADSFSLSCRWAPCCRRPLLCLAHRCWTDLGATEEGPASGRQCLRDCGSLWELPSWREEEGPGLAVGILPHSTASTHMHVFPKSLRPHTVKRQACAQATTVLANSCKRGHTPCCHFEVSNSSSWSTGNGTRRYWAFYIQEPSY